MVKSKSMGTFFDLKDAIPPENREETLYLFEEIFGNRKLPIVEIGSGNGHFLVACAVKNPDKNYIGTEILGGRARKFYSKIEKRSLKNIAVFKGDARRFVWEFLYENTVEEFIILFPDPWPKKRHHKHRLFKDAFIGMLSERLTDGGAVSIATDHAEYRDWVLEEFQKNISFINLHSNEIGYGTSKIG
jgi:tRNA (guanine-N7-)-methyltransferase